MSLDLRIPSGVTTIDAVICDMDGLLIDSEGLSTEAWRRALATYGVALKDADIDDMFGLRIDEDAELIINRYHLAATAPALVEAKSQQMQRLIDSGDLLAMPGASQLLEWLVTSDVPRALATSGLADYAVVCLRAVGFAEVFPVQVTGDEVARGKPAPDIFLLAAERLGLAPARCLVLEDAPHGVAAAVAAGMPVIAVPNAFTGPLSFPPVTARANSLIDVLMWLGG